MASVYGSKMYEVILDHVLFPVAPKRIEWKYNGQNETISLIDEGEANVIQPLGLTEFSLEVLLPHQKYPFARYPNGEFLPPSYYLMHMKKIMEKREPVSFEIVRPGTIYDNLLEMVTVENYTVQEDADEGRDVIVKIELKQYWMYRTKYYIPGPVGTGQLFVERPLGEEHQIPSAENPVEYTVQPGDSLWRICQQQYGDGSKCWDVANRNGIVNPNVIYAGQVITLG